MKMKRVVASLAGLIAPLIFATLPGVAVAQQSYSESNKAVQYIGVQGSQGYVLFTTPPTAGCEYNLIYFDLTTDAGKGYLSLLLTAKATNAPLTRVDYSMTSGVCTAVIFQL